ncbi:hypothetical protein ABZO31_01735 [Streptomyces sp. HUAS MG47]|uniref:hypothetical protein n=1 Tax=Streptomyces solicamelliae TaxID=3231716 RepID=UPI0038778FBC
MTAPSRPSRPVRRLAVAVPAVLAVLAVASCGNPDRDADGRRGPGPRPSATHKCEVSHEKEPITSRFPSFGALRSTSWCGYTLGIDDPRGLAPGPTDTRLVGVLEAVDVKAVRATVDDPALRFAASAPPADLPAEVAALLPADADWRVSEQVDTALTREFYPGTFYHDRRSGQVLFDCVNPERVSDPPSATPDP